MEDYLNDIEAILPDGFDPNDKGFSLDKLGEEAPTTEQAPETQTQTEAAPAAAPEAQEPTTVPDPAPQTAAPQTVKIKYNHEERELSLDEAAVLAQKGMNYDKLNERVQSFEASKARSERLAKQLGYNNPEEMFDAAEKNFIEGQVQAMVDAGTPEPMARFLVKQQLDAVAKEESAQVKTEPEVQTTTVPPVVSDKRAEIKEFVAAYPNVVSVPNEVWEANRKGLRLVDAYKQYLSKQNNAPAATEVQAPAQTTAPTQTPVQTPDATKQQLVQTQAELQVYKQNQAAAAMAPVGGVTGRPGVDTPDSDANDPFMKGFDADY